MLKQLLKGIDRKKLTITVVVVFVYIWITDCIIHGYILGGLYKKTQHLWRSESEMQRRMVWMLLGQLLIAKYLTVLFAKGYEGKGIKEGVRFGLLLAPFAVAGNFIMYAVMPLPINLMWSWIGLGFAQIFGGAVVAAAVYSRK